MTAAGAGGARASNRGMHAFRRDFARLDGRFDLLVIGGGVYGAWIAYDAALRGLSVALVERGDWAGGTSSASSKLIHGGLRYLEYGHLGLVRKALHERSRLLRLAPHRVRALRFLLPLWRDSRAGRLTLSLGLGLYDLLAGDLAGAPPHRSFDREAMLELCPFLEPRGLRAGFSYADAGEDDARFTLEIVAGAAAAGAVAVNRAEAMDLIGAARVEGARVRDRESGAEVEVRADATVLAGGPWIGRFLGREAPPTRLTKGVHLVMPPLPETLAGSQAGDAMLLTARTDRRVFFLIPWYGATLLGTTDTDYDGDPDRVAVEPEDVAYLLREARTRCPGLQWRARDVRGVFCGVRTLQKEIGKSAGAVTREWELTEPRPRLLVPVGGKFTSARVEAAITVDRALAQLGRRAPSRTADRPFPWAPSAFGSWLPRAIRDCEALGLDRECAEAAARRHGTRLPAIHDAIAHAPALAQRIHPQAPFCLAEAPHAVEHEMARTLDDVLRRRVPVAILARLALPQVERVALAIAPRLGWSIDLAQREAAAWHSVQAGALRRAGLGWPPTVKPPGA